VRPPPIFAGERTATLRYMTGQGVSGVGDLPVPKLTVPKLFGLNA